MPRLMSNKIFNSTLSRRVPLRSKKNTQKRYSWLRSKPMKASQKNSISKPRKAPKPRKPLRKVSKAHGVKLRIYYKLRNVFLQENPACQICVVRGLTPAPATEVHHIRGRAGKLLSDSRYWASSCFSCREWPHANPKVAREIGILAPSRDWNRSPIGK